MMGIIQNTNDEFDYAECFDPGEGNKATTNAGTQRHGNLYTPDSGKWQNQDCPYCMEPFAVKKMRSRATGYRLMWYCTHCYRVV